jgi:hypothetical protein
VKFQNVEKKKNVFFQKLKHGSKVKFQNAKIKRIFTKIKTWFKGENFKYKNKLIFSGKKEEASK